MEEKNRDKLIMTGLYVSILLFKIVFICFAVPLQTGSDDTAYFAVPAYLAGYDWSNIVSNAGYYGYGISWMLFPLFKYVNNPTIIYRLSIIICCLIQNFNVVLSYFFLKKYGGILSNKSCILFTIICSFCITARPTSTSNEFILEVLSWGVAVLLGEIYHSTKQVKKEIFSVFLGLLMSYSLTLHTRAITLIIAVIVVDIFYVFYSKKKIIGYSFYITVITGYIAVRALNKYVQMIVWNAQENTVRNTSISIPGEINWTKMNTYKTILSIIIGQICSINFFTGGLLIISLAVLIIYFLKFRLEKEYSFLTFIFLIFFVATIATSLAQAVTWAPSIIEDWDKIGKPLAQHKAFTYIRYFMPYIGPIIGVGVIVYCQNKERLGKVSIQISFLISLIFSVFWANVLVPRMQYDKPAAGSLAMWFHYKSGKAVDASSFLMAIIIFLDFMFVLFICLAKKRVKAYYSIVACLLVFQFIYNTINISYVSSYQNRDRLIKSYNYVMDNNLKNNFDKIYVYDSQYDINDTSSLVYLYQFYFFDKKVLGGVPNKNEEISILFSDSKCAEEIIEQYYEVILSEREYLYIPNIWLKE